MTNFHRSIAIAASLLFAGSVFAASSQPFAGEAPYFNGAQSTVSTLQRAAVRSDAIAHEPAAGEMNTVSMQETGTLTRAQVRSATAQAIRNGFHVESGNAS